MPARPSGCGPFSAVALLAVALGATSADVGAQLFVSAEAQAYPAGVIGRLGVGISRVGWSFTTLGGYNATDRRDWGEHENEEGGGPGLGFRVLRSPRGGEAGFYGEARIDVWFMDVDWTDAGGTRQGTSEVRVIQPTAGVGYQWRTGLGLLRLGAALGWELNTGIVGEPVGEGPIILAGVQVDVGHGPWVP